MGYSIIPLNNSIKPSGLIKLEYQITADEDELKKIRKFEVNLTSLVEKYSLTKIDGTSGLASVNEENGKLTFSKLPTTGEPITFTIEGEIPNQDISNIDTSIETINITLTLKGASPVDFTTEVYINPKVPSIDYFRLYPSIIREGGQTEVSWKCSDITSLSIKYDNGSNVIKDQLGDSGKIDKVSSFENYREAESLHLQACLELQGEDGTILMVNTETSDRMLKIKDTDSLGWTNVTLKELIKYDDDGGEDEEQSTTSEISTIVNLILNDRESDEDEGNKIWALAQVKNHPETTIVWNSYDGLEWTPWRDKDVPQGIEVPTDYLDSPALHFNDQLLFIGGSKVDVGQVSNVIRRFDFSAKRWGEDIDIPGEPRMGHSCVVFPNSDGNDCIWVIGGADRNGNGLNDIRCWTGTDWIDMSPGNFPKRCLFSATVHINENENQELWIGGGLNTYNGNPLNDIWKYNGNNWKKIETLSLGDDIWISTSALTNVAGDIFVISIAESDDSNQLNKFCKNVFIAKDQGSYKFGTNELRGGWSAWGDGRAINYNYALITRGFNGCIWLLAKEYIREGEISNSSLYYCVK